MEIIKPQIQIQLNKGELNAILADAMKDPLASNAIKRILNPFLENSFPQFPEFTNITLGDTEEDGTTTVVLKQPRQTQTSGKETIDKIEDEPEDEVTTDEVVEESESPAYVA